MMAKVLLALVTALLLARLSHWYTLAPLWDVCLVGLWLGGFAVIAGRYITLINEKVDQDGNSN